MSEIIIGQVAATRDFFRILELQRRDPVKIAPEKLSEMLGGDGTMILKPDQCATLQELYENNYCAARVPVGGGKTLIAMLAPVLLKAKRPVFICPKRIMESIKAHYKELKKHWRAKTPMPEFISYGLISRRPDILDTHDPDLVICDEAHNFGGKSARTKRFLAWRSRNRHIPLLLLSGTFMRRSILEFAHLAEACAGKEKSPFPRTKSELAIWSQAVDSRVEVRARPGALTLMAGRPGMKPLTKNANVDDVREALSKWVFDTRGFYRGTSSSVDCSIVVEMYEQELTPEIRALMRRMQEKREDWNGDPCTPADVWRHTKTLATGFHYQWTQPGPEEWLKRRRSFKRQIRDIAEMELPGLDTELMITNAIRNGRFDVKRYERWKEVKDQFKPKTMAVWHTDHVLNQIVKDAEKLKDVWIWVMFTELGQKLSEITGWPYFCKEGFTDEKNKRHAGTHRGCPGILSVQSCCEGLNLQFWANNIIATPPTVNWHQMMARTHRFGQEADEVYFKVYCARQRRDIDLAFQDARAGTGLEGETHKLLLADIIDNKKTSKGTQQ